MREFKDHAGGNASEDGLPPRPRGCPIHPLYPRPTEGGGGECPVCGKPPAPSLTISGPVLGSRPVHGPKAAFSVPSGPVLPFEALTGGAVHAPGSACSVPVSLRWTRSGASGLGDGYPRGRWLSLPEQRGDPKTSAEDQGTISRFPLPRRVDSLLTGV